MKLAHIALYAAALAVVIMMDGFERLSRSDSCADTIPATAFKFPLTERMLTTTVTPRVQLDVDGLSETTYQSLSWEASSNPHLDPLGRSEVRLMLEVCRQFHAHFALDVFDNLQIHRNNIVLLHVRNTRNNCGVSVSVNVAEYERRMDRDIETDTKKNIQIAILVVIFCCILASL